MNVIVGSKNRVKVDAVRETLTLYDAFAKARVRGVDVPSGVSEQPISIDEIIQGAMNRARAAFVDCDYSVGIESGLMQIPLTKTGYMDTTACALYDGKEFHLGLSPCVELPKRVIDKAIHESMNLNDACRSAGLTDKRKLGNEEGFVGILTGGRITRKEYTKQAIIMAMVHLENDMG